MLGAAIDDLFDMRDFALSIKVGRRLIAEYPKADSKITRGAWLVVAHSSYELEIYNDAEVGYLEVLKLTAKDDKTRVQLTDNLAASIYKQGEKARGEEKYRDAVRHFLRIAAVAPASKIRSTAEYDAAAVLLQIRDLDQAITVLLGFRNNYPKHELQKDVTKKIAYAYKELENYSLAAKEYERVAIEAGKEEELVREAMLQAAELYEKAKDADNSLRVYKQFVVKFPKPLEFALDTYYKIAMIHKSQDNLTRYRDTLQHIIKTDATAGAERTDRTRYLAAQSSLVIIEPSYDEFIAIKLVKPFKKTLKQKQKSMKSLVKRYTKLVDYKVADVTAASTFYIAEIYFNFNQSLMQSEKPDGLNEVELEEFTLMVEEQAFPFEEKAIQVHEKNMELLSAGLYSNWIDRSIEKLAKLLPARYAKPEESTNHIAKIDNYIYESPRYERGDASTGFIVNLDFFRYASQNSKHRIHKNQPNGDIGNSKSETVDSLAIEKPDNSAKKIANGEAAAESQVEQTVDDVVSEQAEPSDENKQAQPGELTETESATLEQAQQQLSAKKPDKKEVVTKQNIATEQKAVAGKSNEISNTEDSVKNNAEETIEKTTNQQVVTEQSVRENSGGVDAVSNDSDVPATEEGGNVDVKASVDSTAETNQ